MEQYNIEYKDGHDIREDISHMDETRNADFICSLFEELKYTVQLRNSKSEAEDENYDRLVSPVLNSHNGFLIHLIIKKMKNQMILLMINK